MSSSQHNERIAAQRANICMEFIETTSTNMTTAKHYCQMAAFDMERAVSLFYDAGGGEALPSDDEQEQAAAAAEHNNNGDGGGANTNNHDETLDPISAIVNSVKKQATPQPPNPSSSQLPSNAFAGKGCSLNASSSGGAATGRSASGDDSANDEEPEALKLRVTFYKDGFTSQEEDKAEQADLGTARRRGVHSMPFASSQSTPMIPPKREYETPISQQFIQDVQQSKVPVEYRRLDSKARRPVSATILLDDRRPRLYPMEEYSLQQEQKSKSTFSGSGQTLGGSGGSSSGSGNTRRLLASTARTNQEKNNNSNVLTRIKKSATTSATIDDQRSSMRFGKFIIPEESIFYRTKHSAAFVNLRPIVPGHVLIMPERIVPTMDMLEEQEYLDMWSSVRTIQSILKRQYNCSAFNVAVQDGKDAGQSVPHVHIHILPRKWGDYECNDDVYDELENWAPRPSLTKEKPPKKLEVLDDEDRVDRTPKMMADEAAIYRALLSEQNEK